MVDVVAEVAKEYREVLSNLEEVGTKLRDYRNNTEQSINKLSARFQDVEQRLAREQNSGDFATIRSDGLSRAVKAAIADDSAYEHLRAWNQGTARLTLDGVGIQAALVNEPYDPAPSSNTSMPSQPERGGIMAPVIAQPRLLNFLRTRPVHSDSIEYVQMSTTGDVDYQQGEGTEKAEVEFEGALRRAHITTIAGHTTASRQVLSDHSTLGSMIDSVLRAKLLNKLSFEIINGQGGGGDVLKIDGLLKQGTVMVDPTATDFADQIGEAVVKQSNLGFHPNLIVVNPLTWFGEIGTAKTETEKAYLFGSPAAPIPPALWNLPVALEPALPQGRALIMDLSYITVLDRERPSILLSNSHKDYFTRNLVAILGELRAGLEILDEGAVFIVGSDTPPGESSSGS